MIRLLEIEIPDGWKDTMAEAFGDCIATALAPGVRMILVRQPTNDGNDDEVLREWVTPE